MKKKLVRRQRDPNNFPSRWYKKIANPSKIAIFANKRIYFLILMGIPQLVTWFEINNNSNITAKEFDVPILVCGLTGLDIFDTDIGKFNM